MLYFLTFIASFIIAMLATPLVRIIARGANVLDYPVSKRKIHKNPTPLLGGMAVFGAFTIVSLFLWSQGLINTESITNLQFLALLLGGGVLLLTGTIDDVYTLSPRQQLIGPLGAALIVIISGVTIHFVTNPFGGVLAFSAGVGTVLAFVWLLAMMFTTKLLDGLDGLASGITVIAAVVIFVVSLFWDQPLSGTSLLAIALAGSAVGFLIYNWHPASIFLGEGGSLFCGFALGVLAIISGSKIATALLVMGIPMLDVVWVIIRRLWQGHSPAQADRKHLHFRLLDIGLTHRQAVLVLYGLTASFGAIALLSSSFEKVIALVGLLLVMLLLGFLLVTSYRRKQST